MRSAYLLLAGVLLGYLAQKEKQFRSEVVAIGAIIRQADVRAGFKKTMTAVFDALLRLFDARRVVLVVQDRSSDEAYMWEADRTSEDSAGFGSLGAARIGQRGALPVRARGRCLAHHPARHASPAVGTSSRWIVAGRGSAPSRSRSPRNSSCPSPHSIS